MVTTIAAVAVVIPYTWASEEPGRTEAGRPAGNATFVGRMPAAAGGVPKAAAVRADREAAAAVEPQPGTPGPVVSAVVRDRNVMDIFGVDAGQRIYTAAWKPDHTDGWHRWAQLNGGMAAPGTSVYGVSRQTDQLDIFAVGTDMKVYSAAWNPSDGTRWAGWWRIGNLTVAPNTSVHAVRSVSRNSIDIFAVGSDRKVYTTNWYPSSGWATWTRLDGTTVRANTMVFGVQRGADIDIFTVDTNADVAWASYISGAGWQPWRALNMGSYIINAGSNVFPVSRHPGKIDIFTVARSGGFLIDDVVTFSWNNNTNQWSAIGRVLDVRPRYGSTVFATSRRVDFVDVFAVGSNGKVYTASSDNGAPYRGWWQIGSMTAAAGTSVFGTVRDRDHLDVFGIDTDYGTKTAAWSPNTSGWAGWWDVGPRGQAGAFLESTADINISGGVHGWSTLRISSGGAWDFRGRLNNSGVPSYIAALVWTVSVPSGKVFTFKMDADLASLAHPNEEDGRSYYWQRVGASNELAQHWDEILDSGTWSWRANSDVDVSDLVIESITALGFIAQVVTVISLL
jgi:hypothetical protein